MSRAGGTSAHRPVNAGGQCAMGRAAQHWVLHAKIDTGYSEKSHLGLGVALDGKKS